jgi:hypothetical protein
VDQIGRDHVLFEDDQTFLSPDFRDEGVIVVSMLRVVRPIIRLGRSEHHLGEIVTRHKALCNEDCQPYEGEAPNARAILPQLPALGAFPITSMCPHDALFLVIMIAFVLFNIPRGTP